MFLVLALVALLHSKLWWCFFHTVSRFSFCAQMMDILNTHTPNNKHLPMGPSMRATAVIRLSLSTIKPRKGYVFSFSAWDTAHGRSLDITGRSLDITWKITGHHHQYVLCCRGHIYVHPVGDTRTCASVWPIVLWH